MEPWRVGELQAERWRVWPWRAAPWRSGMLIEKRTDTQDRFTGDRIAPSEGLRVACRLQPRNDTASSMHYREAQNRGEEEAVVVWAMARMVDPAVDRDRLAWKGDGRSSRPATIVQA